MRAAPARPDLHTEENTMKRMDPRIRSARNAIRTYERIKGISTMQDIPETLCDLLTDLRHFCAEQHVDFDAAFRMSEFHFIAETEE